MYFHPFVQLSWHISVIILVVSILLSVTNLYNNRTQIIYDFYHFSSANVISYLIVWIKMRNKYRYNLDLLKRLYKWICQIKLNVLLGFTIIILLSRLKNVNAILSFSLVLERISQLFGLYIVLYLMKHLLLMECFFFVFILDCLSEKEILVPLTRWFSVSRPLETAASTFTFQFFVYPLLPHKETSLHP